MLQPAIRSRATPSSPAAAAAQPGPAQAAAVSTEHNLYDGPGLAGASVLCMVSKKGYLAYRNIEEFHNLWHVGTKDKLPPPPGLGYQWLPKLGKWKAAVSHQGEQRYLGLFSSEEAAKQAVADFRATHPSHRIRKLDSVRRNHVRSVDEGSLIAGRSGILDVREHGIAKLLRITAASGNSVTCSPGQSILTASGRRPAESLAVGNTIIVTGRTVFPSERLVPPSLRAGIGVWTSMQRARLIADIDRCYLCGNTYKREDLTLDHEIPVVVDLLKALDVRNLRPACEPCHKTKSSSEQSLAKRNGSTSIGKPDVITEITSGGTGSVYSLLIAGAPGNYLANRVFVGSATE